MLDGFIAYPLHWLRKRHQKPDQIDANGCKTDNQSFDSTEGDAKTLFTKKWKTASPAMRSELADLLVDCADTLKVSCKKVEPSFLTLGRDLQSIHSAAIDLTQRTITATQSYSGNSEDRILDKVVALAKESLIKLGSDCSNLTDNLDQSDHIVQHLNSLIRLSRSIEGISKSLNMIALNINIESARLDDDQEIFINLAQGIKRLSESVKGLSEEMGEDAHSAQSRLLAAHSILRQNIDQLGITAQTAEKALNEAAPAVEKILGLSLEILSKTGEDARQISDRVGDIVVGIQIHDSINQRVDHIVSSLEEARKLCSSGSQEAENEEKLGAAHATVYLQATQLSNIITELDDVYQCSMEAFHFIEKTIEKMAGPLGELYSDYRVRSELNDNQSPISSLTSALEHINGLIGQAAEKILQLNSATEASMESVGRLAGHRDSILSINSEIHLGALNAIVNSIHLGDRGAAIAVLVQEMSEMAAHSNALAADVGKIINEITETAQKMKARLQDNQNEDTAERLISGLHQFTEQCDAFREESVTISEEGEILRNNISSVKVRLEFLEHFSSELRRHLEQVRKISEELSPWAGKTAPGLSMDQNKIKDRYTMDKERDIHQSFINHPADHMAVTHRYAGTESVDDIDIFENPIETENPGGEKPEATEIDLGDNVDLF